MRGRDEVRSARSRSLRRALTRPEFLLWSRLRNRQLDGLKFVRQEPVRPYYADFVCRERRLIVEVDGGQHSQRPADAVRESELASLGYRVIRFWNNEVTDNIDGVLQRLLSELRK
jgi:very-short-patch-repair endonuclease